MSKPDIIAIVWSPHEARTASYAKWLNAPLYNIHYLKARRPWMAPLKYILQTLKTWQVLASQRPKIVYVTNSPPFASLAVMLYCAVTTSQFIMDTHPPTLFSKKWGWSKPLTRFLSMRAIMNITDQERFANMFRSWGAKVMVLENPPKNIDPHRLEDVSIPDEPEFVYVGTFGGDEPVEIILDAARRLPNIRFYILGDTELARREWLENPPPNVTFTGYITKEAYWNRLHSARALIILTTHEHSLLGGAMDGLYIDKPVIVSDQPTLREYFTKGAVLIPNTGDGITNGVQEILSNEEHYKQGIQELRRDVEARWENNFQQLKSIIWSESHERAKQQDTE
jgi:glycosyltransferase involved in cell wall biosynthesis